MGAREGDDHQHRHRRARSRCCSTRRSTRSTATINYAQAAVPGLSAPLLQFVNGNLQTLEMELLARHLRGARRAAARPRGDDVRALTRRSTDLMDIDPTTHAPPVLLFTWGSLSFTCVLARATQRFMMFLPRRHAGARAPPGDVQRVPQRRARGEGDQARDRRLLQASTSSAGRDAARRSPPTSTATRALWRPIALRNGIDDPRALRVGAARCSIPPLPFRDPETGEVYALTSDRPATRPTSRSTSTARRCRPRCAPRSRRLRCRPALEGADRVELALANEDLRWLDHPLLALDTRAARCRSATRPDPLDAGVRRRDRRARRRRFPSGGAPTLTVAAQDRLQRLQQGDEGALVRDPDPDVGNMPLPDIAVARHRRARERARPDLRPGRRRALGHPRRRRGGRGARRPRRRCRSSIRKQDGESDFDFLQRIARENGWELLDRPRRAARRPPAALLLAARPPDADVDARLRPLAARLHAARLSKVGQIVVGHRVRLGRADQDAASPSRVGWDWDRAAADDRRSRPASCRPRRGRRPTCIVDEPLTPSSAPRSDPRRSCSRG